MGVVLLRGITWRSFVLVAFEACLIVAGILFAAWLRLGRDATWLLQQEHFFAKSLLVAAVCQLALYFSDLYDLRVVADRRELFVRLVQALGVTSLVLGVLYFLGPGLIIGRGVFAVAVVVILTLVAGWRIGFEWLTRTMGPRERLLLVGTSQAAVELARELHARRELGVRIVGFVDPDPSRAGEPVFNPAVLGAIADIPAIVASQKVDRVVVSMSDARGRLPMDQLLDMKLRGVRFDHLADVYEEYTGKIAIEHLRPSWLIFNPGFEKSRALLALKRTLDISFGLGLALLTLPLTLLVAALVRLTSPGPVLYHQDRVGQDGRVFTIHKFRSMRVDAEAETGPVWVQQNDTRITPVGRLLRRARLDELPQLWNLIRGDMSFVGPRPERPEFVAQLTQQIPFYGQRHVIKPGLTGWAQVSYTYGASVEDAMEKLQYDLFYLKHMSIAFDLFIIMKTVKTVVLQRGA